MTVCKTKLALHYRPVKKHRRDTEGCCATCREKFWQGIHDAAGRFLRAEERCAPIVGNNSPVSRKHRLRMDHVCDRYRK